MTTDDRDVSQLRVQLKDYILDSETEIRENLKVGIFRGHSDPTVVRMQQVVDALIAKVRQEARAAALRDAVEAIKAAMPEEDDGWEKSIAVAWMRHAVAAIEALGGER